MGTREYAGWWIFAVIIFGLLFSQYSNGQGRTKTMATLLLDEQFVDESYTSRGWSSDLLAGSGYRKEEDPAFGRVMYNEWTGIGQDGGRMPDNIGAGVVFPLTRAQIENGITIYWAQKWVNMIDNPATADNVHIGVRGNFLQPVMGNVSGQWIVDMLPASSGIRVNNGRIMDRGHNVVPRYPQYAPDRIPYTDTFGGGFIKTLTGSSYLQDDQWFEFMLFVDPNGGGGAGKSRLYHRRLGETAWETDWDVTQQICAGVGDTGMVGIGTYLHSRNGTTAAPVRAYWGRFTVWEGDAIKDGSVDDLIGGDDPGDPDQAALEVLNFGVEVSGVNAVIAWDTNRPTNAVVDYGPTDTRGMILRDTELSEHHEFRLEGLAENHTYFFRYSSKDEGGETVFDQNNSTFTTGSVVVEPDPEPEGFTIVLETAPKTGESVIFDGEKWVTIDLRAELKRILETEVNLTVS